jgi:hypothetical protein
VEQSATAPVVFGQSGLHSTHPPRRGCKVRWRWVARPPTVGPPPLGRGSRLRRAVGVRSAGDQAAAPPNGPGKNSERLERLTWHTLPGRPLKKGSDPLAGFVFPEGGRKKCTTETQRTQRRQAERKLVVEGFWFSLCPLCLCGSFLLDALRKLLPARGSDPLFHGLLALFASANAVRRTPWT